MKAWLKQIFFDPFLALLRQGMSPEKMAQCVAMGLVIAVFPALGLTTLMAIGAALAFRLNMVAIQTVNYLAYPLQFFLLIPFYRAGEHLFNEPPLPLSPAQVFQAVKESPLQALQQLWKVTWHAALVWAVLAPLAVTLLSLIFTPLFKRFAPRGSQPKNA